MEIIKIWNDKASDKQLASISERLKNGEIGIIPTDTTYAIVCDALNTKAVDNICKLKGINPQKSNLSVICSGIAMAAEYSKIENNMFRLIKANTPGPFTFLLRAASKLPKAFKGRKIVGVRIPDNDFDLRLAEYMENPLLTTSIQYEDLDHAQNPSLITENYEYSVDFMVEGDDGDVEVSTIVDCTGTTPEIIREGKGELI